MIKYNHYMIYEGKNILFELTNGIFQQQACQKKSS